MEHSSSLSLCLGDLIANHGYKNVRKTGRTNLANRAELLSIALVE
jgi:hypothetical protein